MGTYKLGLGELASIIDDDIRNIEGDFDLSVLKQAFDMVFYELEREEKKLREKNNVH